MNKYTKEEKGPQIVREIWKKRNTKWQLKGWQSSDDYDNNDDNNDYNGDDDDNLDNDDKSRCS